MAKRKTVTLLVDFFDASTNMTKQVVESTEVGGPGDHYKKPSEFINEFSRSYNKINMGCSGNKFVITNIIIG